MTTGVPPRPVRPHGPWLLAAAGLVLAAVATTAGAIGGPPTAALAEIEPPWPGAGAGRWITHANGDRINRLLREDGVAWAATDGGGVVRWDLASGDFDQLLAPQDGLPSNVVHDLARTPDGALWVATARGLARWDAAARRFRAVTPDVSPGMPARVTTALEAAPDGRLWVGFAQEWDPSRPHPETREPGAFKPGGLARYAPATDTWDEETHVSLRGSIKDEDYKTIPSENITDLATGSDGILWIGTRPYHVWNAKACDDNDCRKDAPGYWVPAGGGLAARQGDTWAAWVSAQSSSSCFGSHVTALRADAGGRMWVGTLGHGLLVMQNGLRKTGCQSGQPSYTRPKRAGIDGGLRGNSVWSIDVDDRGHVWIGNGDGSAVGRGIVILDHNGTFDDSTGCECPTRSDDTWTYLDFDGAPGDSDALVTALSVGPGSTLLGTRDHANGDGFGLRALHPAEERWEPLRTADRGLPSNHIVDLAHNAVTGEIWATFRSRGVGRFDGRRWQSWRMFGPGAQVASVTLDTRAGLARLPVDLPTAEAFVRAFPVLPAMVRVGDDPVFYRVRRYVPPAGNLSAMLEVTPKLGRTAKAGTRVFTVDRGPASDQATQIAVDGDGSVWVGGRETVWLGQDCPSDRASTGECWLDGGIARWDGSRWQAYDQENSAIPDQEVQSVALDQRGRVWVGTGNGKSEGNGIGIVDPATGDWTVMDRTALPAQQRFGSNGIADIDVDPENGDVWVAHHGVIEYHENLSGSYDRVYTGGGVSRWDGTAWRTWAKPAARLTAFGPAGDLASILVDRVHGRVWTGAWVDAAEFHWLQGYGINASVNWCPLSTCTDGGWESRVWPEDGTVADIALDAGGRVWVGTHRNGVGIVPPANGVKLWDGSAWYHLSPDDSGVVADEVTALVQAGGSMWIGSFGLGISEFVAVPPATPTPADTRAPSDTPAPAPTATPPATPTDEHTPTPEASATPTATATARPSATPTGGCYAGAPCALFVPLVANGDGCAACPPPTATARGATATPVPSTTGPPATDTAAPTPSPSATTTATATPRPSATPAPPTATASATPTMTATPSPTQTPAPSATPTPKVAPLGTWSLFEPAPGLRIPNVDFFDVHGSSPGNVWIVGAKGTALFWDGQELFIETLPTQEDLTRVFMLSDRRGYIVGTNGTVFEMRSGRWARAATGSISDHWNAVGAVEVGGAPRAWILGNDRGNRLFFDGQQWAPTSPDDRNTNHKYTGVAVLGPTRAFAVQSGSGGRIFEWNGTAWLPGPSPGPMHDIHMRSATEGVMVGDNGSVWQIGATGTWSAMPQRPPARGATLNTVYMAGPERIFAGGTLTSLFIWDGAGWVSQTVRASSRDVQGIWVSDDAADGWGVGKGGLLMRYR